MLWWVKGEEQHTVSNYLSHKDGAYMGEVKLTLVLTTLCVNNSTKESSSSFVWNWKIKMYCKIFFFLKNATFDVPEAAPTLSIKKGLLRSFVHNCFLPELIIPCFDGKLWIPLQSWPLVCWTHSQLREATRPSQFFIIICIAYCLLPVLASSPLQKSF